MGGSDTPRETRRYTVAEAADALGITTGAVRNRLSRGTLRSVKERGTVYVLLPEPGLAETPRDVGRDAAGTPSDTPLVDELRDRVRYLERQVEEEREARRRADMLLARLVERVPEIEAPASPDAPESAEPRSDRPGPPDAGGEPGAPSENVSVERSWWRRMFGGS